MQKNNINPNIINFNKFSSIGLDRFNKCKHRSINPIITSSCCSTKKSLNFKCQLKEIFPLCYDKDCSGCDTYEPRDIK